MWASAPVAPQSSHLYLKSCGQVTRPLGSLSWWLMKTLSGSLLRLQKPQGPQAVVGRAALALAMSGFDLGLVSEIRLSCWRSGGLALGGGSSGNGVRAR